MSKYSYFFGAGVALAAFAFPLLRRYNEASNKIVVLEQERKNFPVNMVSLNREGPDFYRAVIDYGEGNFVTNYLGKVEKPLKDSKLVGRVGEESQ